MVAVDVSPVMIERIHARTSALGIPNVACVRSGFLTYEREGERADFVYSRNALHHLPDFWKALALDRIAGILKPGGVLLLRDLVFSFEPGNASRAIDEWLASTSNDEASGWTRIELERHIREEHSTYTWLLEEMLTRAGFRISQTTVDPSGFYATYMCNSVA